MGDLAGDLGDLGEAALLTPAGGLSIITVLLDGGGLLLTGCVPKYSKVFY